MSHIHVYTQLILATVRGSFLDTLAAKEMSVAWSLYKYAFPSYGPKERIWGLWSKFSLSWIPASSDRIITLRFVPSSCPQQSQKMEVSGILTQTICSPYVAVIVVGSYKRYQQ
jgi:hypothetical protein